MALLIIGDGAVVVAFGILGESAVDEGSGVIRA